MLNDYEYVDDLDDLDVEFDDDACADYLESTILERCTECDCIISDAEIDACEASRVCFDCMGSLNMEG